ncbi:hypothetical protein [Stutzerimonas stutzeri]|uniref:hypothetical protein n=1 Tax=Stutzerimonas stutzeri TaxID=316 RepID=UPI000F7937A7|nr:hypothetical protein [Stutzerimonas stutzeri]RRV91012.1 hypothetical protein EGJ11_01350 [Stutzerimonas stutzeri]
MTQHTVTIHFTYAVGGETKEGSTEVRARVENVESEEGWRFMATWLVFRAIGQAESELILKTPNGWYGNINGFATPETELIGPIDLHIREFPEVLLNRDEYTLNRRLDKPRKLVLP